uniref:EamA domain-containing protein n=1 Tax=viral metagenome TaxID=1070528 RepID=A0A6C0KJ09_9ZZZZ
MNISNNWYIVSIILALIYTSYILLSQCIINTFHIKPRVIFVNVICIAALLCLVTQHKDIIRPKLSIPYFILLLIGILIYLQNYFLQLGTSLPTNMGLIDGFAICIYLPMSTLFLYFLFKEKVNKRKIFGIILACMAGYFILT